MNVYRRHVNMSVPILWEASSALAIPGTSWTSMEDPAEVYVVWILYSIQEHIQMHISSHRFVWQYYAWR